MSLQHLIRPRISAISSPLTTLHLLTNQDNGIAPRSHFTASRISSTPGVR